MLCGFQLFLISFSKLAPLAALTYLNFVMWSSIALYPTLSSNELSLIDLRTLTPYIHQNLQTFHAFTFCVSCSFVNRCICLTRFMKFCRGLFVLLSFRHLTHLCLQTLQFECLLALAKLGEAFSNLAKLN